MTGNVHAFLAEHAECLSELNSEDLKYLGAVLLAKGIIGQTKNRYYDLEGEEQSNAATLAEIHNHQTNRSLCVEEDVIEEIEKMLD